MDDVWISGRLANAKVKRFVVRVCLHDIHPFIPLHRSLTLFE